MLENKIRNTAVAGRFYPADSDGIKEIIETIYKIEKEKIDFNKANNRLYGAVLPHAAFMYSAYQAIHFFALLPYIQQDIDTFVIINPNHTGYGKPISLDTHQFWNTPLGNIEQDADFINELALPFSNDAHKYEHSGEIMLPLLQYFAKKPFKIVMITLSQQNWQNAKLLANKINEAAQKLNRNIMLIASSDFTHFESVETSKRLDNLVLAEISKQNTIELEKTVKQNNISVCGFGTIMCLMEYSALQGQYKSDIIARGHSGQINHSQEVVNYISIVFRNYELRIRNYELGIRN